MKRTSNPGRPFVTVVVAVAAVWSGTTGTAQEPVQAALRQLEGEPPPETRFPAAKATPALIALGEKLFKDTRLSSSGTMSCASCHLPERAFTEDKPQAIGQLGMALGRNTPTIFGLASVKDYPVGGNLMESPRMVPLEERVLAPLNDHFEMDAVAAASATRLKEDAKLAAAFDGVFDEAAVEKETGPSETGVTAGRLGVALAAYIRSLRHWEGPSHFALAGGNVQLDEKIGRGLDLFREEARCQSCHSGPGLTDGKLHVVAPLRLLSMRAQSFPESRPGVAGTPVAEAAARQGAQIRVQVGKRVIGGGRYGGMQQSPERQTLTLLEVRRTGPYFRDGSVATLPEALKNHVADLRDIGSRRDEILKNPGALLSEQIKSPRRLPLPLSPTAKEQLGSDSWIPPVLSAQQMDDLVAFLESLSPSD